MLIYAVGNASFSQSFATFTNNNKNKIEITKNQTTVLKMQVNGFSTTNMKHVAHQFQHSYFSLLLSQLFFVRRPKTYGDLCTVVKQASLKMSSPMATQA